MGNAVLKTEQRTDALGEKDRAVGSGVPWNFRSRDIDELIPKDTSSSKTQGKVVHQPLAVKREDASI